MLVFFGQLVLPRHLLTELQNLTTSHLALLLPPGFMDRRSPLPGLCPTKDHADFEDQSVRALLAARDVDDQTPLHRAARHGHLEVRWGTEGRSGSSGSRRTAEG